jgi:uncharacterized membrane protein YfcA
MWGYRRELRQTRTQLYFLIFPSVVGGIAGAVLLRPNAARSVRQARTFPYSVCNNSIHAAGNCPALVAELHQHPTTDGARWLAGAAAFQFGVAVYGGYFGAGIGILMLAALSLLGLTDIHQMNGLKTLFALCINVVASIYFMMAGLVEWPVAATMALGAISGGYGGAGLARKLGPLVVRRTVIAIGFAMTISLFVKQF